METIPSIPSKVPEAGVVKIQAIFRGLRSRDVHVKRLKQGAPIVCPFVSSSSAVTNDLIRLVNVKSFDVVIDVGCGDASVLIDLAKTSGARCIGYEIDSVLCATARRKIAESGLTSVVIVEGDIMSADFSVATVIYIFLVPSCLQALSPLLLKKALPGTRIVSYLFPFPEEDGWTLSDTFDTEDVINTLKLDSRKTLYSYVAPGRSSSA